MYVDLHLHLLPGVDDGARDLDESLAMARLLCERGYERAAVTPHIRPGFFDNEAGALREVLAGVRAALSEAGIPLELVEGAEHYLSPEVIELLLAGEGLPLGGTTHVLLEAPLEGPVPVLEQVAFQLEVGGLRPLFAHPERCACLQDLERARGLHERGVRYQLDLGSLAGAYGRAPKKWARRLLEEGLYSVAGSDLHRAEQGRKLLARWQETLIDRIGEDAARRLLSENPGRLLRGEALA
ncbi:MAG: protein tyrosine phosphatase [Deltaproteobacteria bacterium]|nr:protein tyrosine phosphatase [Deltaproteobacteria bacterium]